MISSLSHQQFTTPIPVTRSTKHGNGCCDRWMTGSESKRKGGPPLYSVITQYNLECYITLIPRRRFRILGTITNKSPVSDCFCACRFAMRADLRVGKNNVLEAGFAGADSFWAGPT